MVWGNSQTQSKPRFGFGSVRRKQSPIRRLNNRSSHPHLINSPSFLSTPSKTCSKISCAALKPTAAGYKTALKKRISHPRQIDRNTDKISEESGLMSSKHMETGSQRELTYPVIPAFR